MSEVFTLITGAASGFGRNIAERLAPSKRLILSDLDAGKLETVRNTCARSGQHLLWPRDLNQSVAEEFAVFLLKENICIEHYIHSAGVFGLQFPRAHDMAFVSRIFNVNLFAAIELIRTLTQKKTNGGALRTITIISSIGTRVGAPGQYVYAASKGAVNGLCLALALELAPTVRVNTVLPSYIESGMNQDQFAQADFLASIRAMHPLGLGRPEDVADAVVFLILDHARWITGQELVVDGGRSIGKTLLPVK